MGPKLILAAIVSLCISSHCSADAVRKSRVVDPIELRKQEQEKLRQARQLNLRRMAERIKLLKRIEELTHQQLRVLVAMHKSDEETRRQLQLQVDKLAEEIQMLRRVVEKMNK